MRPRAGGHEGAGRVQKSVDGTPRFNEPAAPSQALPAALPHSQGGRGAPPRHGHRKGIALLVETSSVEEILKIAGTHSDPSMCAPDSIRARYGIKSEPDILGKDFWWDNAFHRPIDTREAKRDVALLFP